MNYFHQILGHLQKDLRLEWRGRDAINAMLFFSLLVVAIFSLAFDPTGYPTTTRQLCVLAISQTGLPAARPSSATAAGVRWASQGPTRT